MFILQLVASLCFVLGVGVSVLYRSRERDEAARTKNRAIRSDVNVVGGAPAYTITPIPFLPLNPPNLRVRRFITERRGVRVCVVGPGFIWSRAGAERR